MWRYATQHRHSAHIAVGKRASPSSLRMVAKSMPMCLSAFPFWGEVEGHVRSSTIPWVLSRGHSGVSVLGASIVPYETDATVCALVEVYFDDLGESVANRNERDECQNLCPNILFILFSSPASSLSASASLAHPYMHTLLIQIPWIHVDMLD